MQPRNIEELLYQTLMKSPAFHRFVRSIYYKVNGLDPANFEKGRGDYIPNLNEGFKVTRTQKFKAWRLLFYDEWRATFGLRKKHDI